MQLCLLVEGLRSRGVEQRVLVPHGAALSAQLDTVPVDLRGRWQGAGAIREQIDAFRPDVVAAHTSHGLALLTGQPRVVVHRRVDFLPSRWSGSRYRSALGVIAVSRAVAQVVRWRGVERIRVVWDGVRTGAQASPSAQPRFVAVGALVPHKDHETLMRAMVDMPFGLDVVGDGPLRSRLERQAHHLGVGDRVAFLGQRSDVDVHLGKALALVHPSREEGLGQVVLEALSRQLPVVATRAGGIPEGVEGDGLLVPARDPRALARAMRTMAVEHPRWRDHLHTRVLAREARFGVDAMVDGTLRAYEGWTGIRA